MILQTLSTRNFRSLEDAAHQFDPRANVFLGDNGQGKTNLLEAIYFLATTRSFRTPRVVNLLRLGARNLYAQGECEEGGIVRSLSVGILGGDERRRQLQVNGQKASLSEYLQVLPVVAYSAARLEIIRGGPDERRRFLDRGIASLRVPYLRELGRFSRVLKQRNALLQRIADGTEKKSSLEPWDGELVMAAGPIVRARDQYTRDLGVALDSLIEAYAPSLHSIVMTYRPAGVVADEKESRVNVASLRARELAAGFTLSGPHRDVLEFKARGVGASDLLSSGEVKMLTLLLKLAKVQVYRAQTGRSPAFLLDDIDAELDLGVIQRLLSSLLGSGQFFTTSAKESIFRLLEVGSHRRFLVRQGGVSEER